MDEVRSHVRLDLPPNRRQGRPKDCSASFSNPMLEGPKCRFRREARARERHRHRPVDSLKALDPNRPIREADMCGALAHVRFGPKADSCSAAKRIVIRSPHRRAAGMTRGIGADHWQTNTFSALNNAFGSY